MIAAQQMCFLSGIVVMYQLVFVLCLLVPTDVAAFLSPGASGTVSLQQPKLNNDRRVTNLSQAEMVPMEAAGLADWISTTESIISGQIGKDATSPAVTLLLSNINEAGMTAAAATPPGLDDTTKLGLTAFAGVGVAAAGFKAAVYWRMQYVVAALLTNRVPVVPGGAEILELSARDSKSLYYMPAGNIRRVTLSAIKDLDQNIVDGAAIQAKVPAAIVRKQEKGKLNCPSQTMDCVISVYGFSGGVAKGSEEGAGVSIRDLAKEVARVLKPGGTVLFIEKGQVPELVEVLREALGKVEVNTVQNFVDPYCVALATKTVDVGGDEGKDGAYADSAAGEGKNRRDRRIKKAGSKRR